MRNFFKYASALNLISLADQVVGVVSASGDNIKYDDDRGFGKEFQWRTLNDAFKEAKITRKPIFLVIHRSWCPACQKLRANFEKSMKLLELSNKFIMVNVENTVDMVNNSQRFYPDGKYVPRILFFTPKGELIKEAYNRSSKADPNFRYFYSTPGQIIGTMHFVLKHDFYSKKFIPLKYEDTIKVNVKNDDKTDVTKPTVLN